MNIKESSQWEESITLLTRKQRVEGGLDGAANIQAKELANRTAWLKDQLEGISDYREYTFYPTQEDPDGTISGLKNTPSGKFFRVVQGINSSRSFVYYMNDAGSAREMASLPGQRSIEYISEIVQRLLTALHVMAEGSTGSGSDTVQNLATGFNVLAESINNLSVENQKNSSGLSGLVSSVQICTEMLKTLAAEVITPDGASQYGYVAFSVPGTVNAGNGSFGTDTRYRRTGMIPVRKGDVVRLTVYTTSATAGHAAALYDSSGAYVGPLGIMCASYAAYQARYYQCEISQDGFVVANTLDQSASSSVDVTGAALTIDHRLRSRAADAVIKLTKSDLIPVRLDNGNINASSITQDGIVNYSTGLYSCTGGRLLFSGLPVASSPGQSSSLYNVVFYDAAKALIAYRPVFSSSGYVIIPENAAYWAQQIITEALLNKSDFG